MSQKHLARTLSKLKGFEKPKILLEQYLTDSSVAGEVLWLAHMKGFIKDKIILDLGAGTGVLGIGALLLGAKKVVFLEIDSSAISILKENLANLEEEYVLPEYEIIKGDVVNVSGNFDLVVMNPPFGTKIKNVDSLFLSNAFRVSDKVISLHKSSTSDFIKKFFESNNFKVTDVLTFNYPLKKSFDHHDSLVKKISVGAFFAVLKK